MKGDILLSRDSALLLMFSLAPELCLLFPFRLSLTNIIVFHEALSWSSHPPLSVHLQSLWNSQIQNLHFQPFLVITFTLNPIQIFQRDTTVLVIHLFSKFLYVDMDISFFLSATEAGKACHYLQKLHDHKILERFSCILFILYKLFQHFMSHMYTLKEFWSIFTINFLTSRMCLKQLIIRSISTFV